MPTGYTADVGDGKVTDFRTFALRCARNFGATVMQRDEAMDSLPRLREASTHERETLENARKDLKHVLALSDEKCEARAEAEYEERLAEHVRSEKRRAETERRYRDMLYEVRKWKPPTKDHQGLQDFMVQQLEESIKYDCMRFDPPRRLTGAEWKEQQRASLERTIASYTRYAEEEETRTAEANEWITALYDSLPGGRAKLRRRRPNAARRSSHRSGR